MRKFFISNHIISQKSYQSKSHVIRSHEIRSSDQIKCELMNNGKNCDYVKISLDMIISLKKHNGD
jgi:hypothetical protein